MGKEESQGQCVAERDLAEGNGLNPLGTPRDPVEHARVAPPRGKGGDFTH